MSTRTASSRKPGVPASKSGTRPEPALPHERDESPGDAVKPGDNAGASRELIEQAEEDVEAGKVDTDRGIPSNVPHR